MVDTATFRTTGDVVMTFDLPMSEVYRDQLLKGDLIAEDDAARDYLLLLLPKNSQPTESDMTPGEILETVIDEAAEREQVDVTAPGDEEPSTVDGPLSRPPEAGPGSSRKAWAAYAAEQGVDVSDDDTRDDIITKLDK